jgi:hypothetical protein
MAYRINSRNLKVARIIDKQGDSRLRHMRVDHQGTTCTTEYCVARVGLPEKPSQFQAATILNEQEIQKVHDSMVHDSPTSSAWVHPGRPAATGPHYLVPEVNKVIPALNEAQTSLVVNGKTLRKLLDIAIAVSNDVDATMAIRIYPDKGMLRIDNYRDTHDQEFLGVMSEIAYHGNKIPGEPEAGKPVAEVKPKQTSFTLKTATGRRFRA